MSSSYSKIDVAALSYLEELKSDLSSSKPSSKIKEKYQIKILELLISLQETNTYLDRVNRENIQLKRSLEDSKKELEKKGTLLEVVSEEKEQLMFQVKAQVNQIATLEQFKNKAEAQIQQLKNSTLNQKASFQRQFEGYKNKWKIEVEEIQKKLRQMQVALNNKCVELRRAEQEKSLTQKKLMEENKANTVQTSRKLAQAQAQSEVREKKMVAEYESKLNELNNSLRQMGNSASQEKFNSNKLIEILENKVKITQRTLKQVENEKSQLEESQQVLNKDIKQKQKEIKLLRKQNAEQSEKLVQILQQNDQLKSQLSVSETKRKQLQRKENELRNELQAKKDEQISENGIIQKQRSVIKEMKEENKKLKQQIEKIEIKVKQLQSNLYKSGVLLEQEKKKSSQTKTKLQYIQLANVKLNERLVLEEKNKDNIIKSVVTEKDMIEKQNIRLLQLLEVKQSTIQSILSETGQISDLKLSELGMDSKTKDKWKALLKENLKDPSNRRSAVQKYLQS